MFKIPTPSNYPTESWVKKQIKYILDELGAWWYMPNAGNYGVYGVPDFVCCLKGKFVAIEAKKEGGHWGKLLQNVASQIEGKGVGTYIVVDEHGLGNLYYILLSDDFVGVYDLRGKTLKEGICRSQA